MCLMTVVAFFIFHQFRMLNFTILGYESSNLGLISTSTLVVKIELFLYAKDSIFSMF